MLPGRSEGDPPFGYNTEGLVVLWFNACLNWAVAPYTVVFMGYPWRKGFPKRGVRGSQELTKGMLQPKVRLLSRQVTLPAASWGAVAEARINSVRPRTGPVLLRRLPSVVISHLHHLLRPAARVQ